MSGQLALVMTSRDGRAGGGVGDAAAGAPAAGDACGSRGCSPRLVEAARDE